MKHMKTIALSVALIGLAACSSNKNDTPKLDYQSDNKKIISLEVPPDLRDPRNGDLYTLPEGTTARPDALKQTGKQASRVLVKVDSARIERKGSQRWLAVKGKTAQEMWPLLRAFWQEAGFTIYSEEPQSGLMETDWAENRAKLPHQGLRRLFDKVGMGGVYTTSERDKFLIRMEHNDEGGLDIFFTHKGLEEVYTDKSKDNTVWQPRATDPNLEAAFLSRFMQYVGVDEATANKQVAQKAADTQGTAFAKREDDSVLVYGKAERNVNRIAAALDRVGLTVQQFVNERGLFVVRPASNEADIADAKADKKPGMIGRLFKRNKKETAKPKNQPAQLLVALENAGDGQRIHILNADGQPYTGKERKVWLDALYRELH